MRGGKREGAGRPREYDREKDGERKHHSIFCTEYEKWLLREILDYYRRGEIDKTLKHIIVHRQIDEKKRYFSGYMKAVKSKGKDE